MKSLRSCLAVASLLGGVFLADSAFALTAYSTAHLNLRTGPGTQYPVVGVLEYNVRAQLTGCLADGTWCSVNVAGLSGWASSEYLVMDESGQVMPVAGNASQLGIPLVDAVGVAEVVATTAVGVVVGAGGHVAAIIPEPAVLQYIAATPVNPYSVQGEIVVGAVVPAAVQLYEVPGSVYGYTIVNGVRVLVDVNSRAIVYVHR